VAVPRLSSPNRAARNWYPDRPPLSPQGWPDFSPAARAVAPGDPLHLEQKSRIFGFRLSYVGGMILRPSDAGREEPLEGQENREACRSWLMPLPHGVRDRECRVIDGVSARSLKFRSMVLPDRFLDHDKPEKLYRRGLRRERHRRQGPRDAWPRQRCEKEHDRLNDHTL